MIDQERLPDRSCRQCGNPITKNEPDPQELCARCRGLEAGSGLILEHLGPQGKLETIQVQGDPQDAIGEIDLQHSDAANVGAFAGPPDAGNAEAGGANGQRSEHWAPDGHAEPAGRGSLYSDNAVAVWDHLPDDGAERDAVSIVPPTQSGDVGYLSPPPPYDPDRPPWGVSGGIGVWLFSVLAIIVVPTLAVVLWLIYESYVHPGLSMSSNAMRDLLASPSAMLVNVLSLFGAHMITLAVVWAVVTRFGSYRFFSTLGWRWAASPGFPKFWFIIAVVFAMYVIEIGLNVVLPQSHETDFEKLLKTSEQVRVAVAVIAVLTAPLVEEVVYRGVLFSALISRAGFNWTIAIVTALFAMVHFPQYWGAWSGLAGITVLSFTLTIVRAKMKSIFPCIAIHFLFNVVGAVSIILQKS